MISIKVYKYDSSQEANGYRGVEYSANLLQGSETKEDITQELDTCEISLNGLSFQKEFDPQTKFIIDYYQDENDTNPVRTSHWVVQKDMVNQPILSDDNYFDHHISLIEPSVVAQQRLVDNISVTYKLKDVSLEEKVSYDPDTDATTVFNNNGKLENSLNFGLTEEGSTLLNQKKKYRWGKYFELSDAIKIKQNGVVSQKYYIDMQNQTSVNVSFVLPNLKIMAGLQASRLYGYIGNASIDYLIEESPATNEYNITHIWSGSVIENNALGTRYTPDITSNSGINLQECILEEVAWEEDGISSTAYGYYKKYTDTSASSPSYETQQITIRAGYIYKITISLHEFPDNIGSILLHQRKYTKSTPTAGEIIMLSRNYDSTWSAYSVQPFFLTTDMTSAFTSYFVFNQNTRKILLCSSTPYSALALLQKAIINSGIYQKKQNVYIADVNNSNLPFMIDTQYIDELSATSIVENFYSQKNLWEIMIDVGHYIHAIPELKFGPDDKFLITFNELGRTDQKENLGIKSSIFNSRGVEDYISSTSSYVANMVQLGGQIREWVAPKTTNETLLVHNDTAEIITSKPIIELLEVRIKKLANNNDAGIAPNREADMTEFIYEKNVYSLLSLKYNVIPNRGIAMYYELGTNKITGGDYQLPQANTNLYTDYAFKKIIYSAYNGYVTPTPDPLSPPPNPWQDVKVNDFIFYVRYRTKDTVRQTHTRPDLRKYLLNSKYDRYPEHNQFNNQQDVLVDSEKFGNNLFGKLIKTGNTSYEILEWHKDINTLKQKGELYKVNDELYYVAKVTNTWYCSHIISKVTFSKDYNELSAVIGIPSEPRFYEISEQSSIRREVAINDFLLLADEANKDLITDTQDNDNSFVRNTFPFVNLMLKSNTDFARYALTGFKGDIDSRFYDQTVGEADNYREALTPINAYSSGNTLTYEWDMLDNYSAGDMVIDADTPSSAQTDAYKSLMGVGYTDVFGKAALFDFYILGDLPSGYSDYAPIFPTSPINAWRYTLASIHPMEQEPTPENLTNFATLSNNGNPPFDYEIVYVNYNGVNSYYVYINGIWVYNANLIQSHLEEWQDSIYASNMDFYSLSQDLNRSVKGLGLLKDNREQISINYNLQLLTNSDTFVLSPFVFKPNKANIYMVFLDEEVNKLSDGYISSSSIIKNITDTNFENPFTYVPLTVTVQTGGAYRANIDIDSLVSRISSAYFTSAGLHGQRIKSIAIVYNVKQGNEQITDETPAVVGKLPFIIARNIPDTWNKQQALQDWYIGCPVKDSIFTKKQ